MIVVAVAAVIIGFTQGQVVHTVPKGTRSVNGSDDNMGCQEIVVVGVSPAGLKLCRRQFAPSTSYIIDNSTPDIDTSAPNWASRIATVRKNTATHNIPYDNVVLVFNTIDVVNLTSVELDMFICPQWNIGAPNITVYADEYGSRGYGYNAFDNRFVFCGTVAPSRLCCGSLLTVRIPFIWTNSHHFYHYNGYS